jgi:NADP-dependent alcohol dehydrogenase
MISNFTYFNPVKIVFGKGSIAQLPKLVPAGVKVLIVYGGGSIKKNGAYNQVINALKGYETVEFGGIEANPQYETCLKAVALARKENVGFILAVGGGSVLDGVKFIAAATKFEGNEPWDIIVQQGANVKESVPLGCVLTLPATGSEMNQASVISRKETTQKQAFFSPLSFPKFSILDPETTYSLPPRQTANGIVDTFAHTIEQYLTEPVGAEIQDRWAESILCTLVEIGPKLMANPSDYNLRANLMWAATMALNGIIGVGVPQDWATHGIGHELTALYGLDHGQTLAVVFPALLRHQKQAKRAKLLQYADRVWGLTTGSEDERVDAAIDKTEAFFASLGVATRLAGYGITGPQDQIVKKLEETNFHRGMKGEIGAKEAGEILAMCAK